MIEDYDGLDLLDSAGEKVGSVEHTYVDGDSNIQFVSVRTGALLPKHHVVPVDQAESTDDGLKVPYTKDMIEESPSLDAGDSLESDAIQQIRTYYATGDRGALDEKTAAEDQTVGEVGSTYFG